MKDDDKIRNAIGVVKFRLKNNGNCNDAHGDGFHYDGHHIVFARRSICGRGPVSPVDSDMAYVDDDGVMYIRPSVENKSDW